LYKKTERNTEGLNLILFNENDMNDIAKQLRSTAAKYNIEIETSLLVLLCKL
jgi:hypothetical protein